MGQIDHPLPRQLRAPTQGALCRCEALCGATTAHRARAARCIAPRQRYAGRPGAPPRTHSRHMACAAASATPALNRSQARGLAEQTWQSKHHSVTALCPLCAARPVPFLHRLTTEAPPRPPTSRSLASLHLPSRALLCRASDHRGSPASSFRIRFSPLYFPQASGAGLECHARSLRTSLTSNCAV